MNMRKSVMVNMKVISRVKFTLIPPGNEVAVRVMGVGRIALDKTTLPQFEDATFICALSADEAIRVYQDLGVELAARCSFCDHMRLEHRNGDCAGKPKHESIDASGECPCNGFEFRLRQ